jgi:hypothetical protein
VVVVVVPVVEEPLVLAGLVAEVTVQRQERQHQVEQTQEAAVVELDQAQQPLTVAPAVPVLSLFVLHAP